MDYILIDLPSQYSNSQDSDPNYSISNDSTSFDNNKNFQSSGIVEIEISRLKELLLIEARQNQETAPRLKKKCVRLKLSSRIKYFEHIKRLHKKYRFISEKQAIRFNRKLTRHQTVRSVLVEKINDLNKKVELQSADFDRKLVEAGEELIEIESKFKSTVSENKRLETENISLHEKVQKYRKVGFRIKRDKVDAENEQDEYKKDDLVVTFENSDSVSKTKIRAKIRAKIRSVTELTKSSLEPVENGPEYSKNIELENKNISGKRKRESEGKMFPDGKKKRTSFGKNRNHGYI